MASASVSNRLIAAGISGGVGIVLPVAAYAATLSMDGVNDAVREGAAPFGVGALVGVGLFAITAGLMERSSVDADIESLRAEEAERSQDEVSAFSPEETGVFFRRRSRRAGDVPVISRAEGAPSEEEAWREIDSLFSDGSPVSCDAEKSKDLYEIALEQAVAQRPVGQVAPAVVRHSVSPAPAAHFGGAAVGHAVQPQTVQAQTAQPVDSSEAYSASHFAAQPVSSAAPQPAQPVHETMNVQADDRVARWAAALDILDEEDSGAPEASDAVERPRGAHFASKPVEAVPAPKQQVIDPFVHVPSDFIQEASASVSAAQTAQFASQDSTTASLGFEDELRRARAIREGRRETAIHGRVNEILNEELDRIRSRSMKRSVHDFLRVVDGGTSPLPRLGIREA